MLKWLSTPDDALPDWLHTLLLLLVTGSFGAPLLWQGAQAMLTRHLEPVMGPEFGQWLFPRVLEGAAARLAGLELVVLGLSFLALGGAFSRWADERPLLQRLPWGLLALFVALHLGFARLTQ